RRGCACQCHCARGARARHDRLRTRTLDRRRRRRRAHAARRLDRRLTRPDRRVVSTGGHDRRAFFRELLRGATRAASEVESFRRAADDAWRLFGGRDAEDYPSAWLTALPATPTLRLATVDDLRELCAALGREAWAEEAASLAQASIRLTPGVVGGSWLGGGARPPPGRDAPDGRWGACLSRVRSRD